MPKPALVVALAAALVAPLLPLAAQAPQSASADIQLQLGDLLAGEARYRDAADAYQRALAAASADLPLARRARSGLALTLLRSGDFAGARGQAEQLTREDPD